MPERASVFQVTQMGVETTSGTGVAANRKLLSQEFGFGVRPEINSYRPSGGKYPTTAVLNKEWVEGSYKGPLTYTDIIYLLGGVVNKVTSPTTTGTTGKKWTYSPASAAADAPATYTFEHGSAERAEKFAYGMITSLNLTIGRGGPEVSGNILGKSITADVALTGSPTEIPIVPVAAHHFQYYTAATQAGLAGASAMARVLRSEFTLGNRFAPAWYLDGQLSYGVHVETVPEAQMKVLMAADDDGMAWLANMRANSTFFLRAKATGGVIGAGPATYEFQLDAALQVTDVSEWRDEEGVYAVEWTANVVHDGTWGKAFQFDVTNALTAL